MPIFDFKEYASDENVDFVNGPFPEVILNCILCGRKKHLYYNTSKNQWMCHHCGEGGNYVRFIMIRHSFTYEETLDFLRGLGTLTLSGLGRRLKKLGEKHLNTNSIYETDQKMIIFPPRDAYPITLYRYPSFFKKRGFRAILVGKLKPLICNTGRYVGRIIFPFSCDGHKSFVAYSTNPVIEPKTLNPFGSNNESLIYGYDMWGSVETVILVEGITDMLRLLHFGFKAMALLGKNISNGHLYLLYKHPAKEIVVCPDGDVWDGKKLEKRIMGSISEMADFLAKKVRIIKIPDLELDPDKLSKDQWLDLYNNRMTISQLKRQKRLLSLVP